jgi:uncharacterized membrane protein YkoI
MKRITLLILFVLVLLALAGLIIRINAKEVVVKSKENLAFQYISDIKNTTQDLKILSQNGITLENTSKHAKVSPSQAAEIASQVVGGNAKKIIVEYCQIDSYKFTYSNNTPSINTPCYLVSFEGIPRYTKIVFPIPMNTRITSSPKLVPVGYEYNIVVDANSGKILGEFNYR